MSKDLDPGVVLALGAYKHRQKVALFSLIPTARVTSLCANLSDLAQLSLLDDI
jgi:hypothetical protein